MMHCICHSCISRTRDLGWTSHPALPHRCPPGQFPEAISQTAQLVLYLSPHGPLALSDSHSPYLELYTPSPWGDDFLTFPVAPPPPSALPSGQPPEVTSQAAQLVLYLSPCLAVSTIKFCVRSYFTSQGVILPVT